MNYLGHIYLSNDNHDLMYANLYGDFVKGTQISHLPLIIQQGIRLHRMIDSYTDQHSGVRELARSLYDFLPKVSGIAIDLYFDHLLAKHWSKFHAHDFVDYLDSFYNHQPDLWEEYHSKFRDFISIMRLRKWLNHYDGFIGLTKMCHGVSAKLSFENKLSNAPNVFEEKETHIISCFEEFMSDVIREFGLENK